MYCGKKLNCDNKLEYNIEHSIEKGGYSLIKDNIEFLTHCKFNLSVACSICNQSYKTRMIEKVDNNLININLDEKCKLNKCTEICDEYNTIRNEYLKANNIILQPLGVKIKENEYYEIQYDLLTHTIIPKYSNKLKEYDINFIRNHIARFHLNKDMFSEEVIDICTQICNLVESIGDGSEISSYLNIIECRGFNNIIGEQFFEYLKKNFKSIRNMYEFCKVLIILYYI